MTLRDRLFNVAKAELKDAARRIRTSAEQLVQGWGPEQTREDPEIAAIREQVRREEEQGARSRSRSTSAAMNATPEIGRFYANLELPIGASIEEVRASYRRLMRRYHPDKHAMDPEAARVANELTHQIRTAYDGLIAHLERSSERA